MKLPPCETVIPKKNSFHVCKMYVFLDDIENFDAKLEDDSSDRKSDLPTWAGKEDFECIEDFSSSIKGPIILAKEPQKITTVVSTPIFLRDILNSYPSDEAINQQFLIDIKRSNFVINGNTVLREMAGLNYIHYKFQEKAKDLLALCTQATCASAFEWLHFSLPQDYYLTELDHTQVRDKRSNIVLSQSPTEESDVGIQYLKSLQIIHLYSEDDNTNSTSQETIRRVLLKISIDCNLKKSGNTSIEIYLE